MRYGIPLAGLALLISLSGCAEWQPHPVPYATSGSQLILQRALVFPPGTTRIYFQRGEVVTERQLSVWDHHCALALDHAFETTTTLPAASYSVVNTQRSSTLGEWGRGVVTYESSFITAASARPLYALYCEQWTLGNPYDARHHISAAALAETLGEWLRLDSSALPGNQDKSLK